jgi:hypothetical protein
MTIIVGETERVELKAAMARARAHPLPWEELSRTTARDATNNGHIEDRHESPSAEFVKLPFGHGVAITFEEQPAGMCLHISVSGPWPRVPPNMVVCTPPVRCSPPIVPTRPVGTVQRTTDLSTVGGVNRS